MLQRLRVERECALVDQHRCKSVLGADVSATFQ